MANVVNMNSLLNGKDSRWLQLEVCREFQRNKCSRQDTECKFAHPPANVEVQNGKVTACYDSIKVSIASTEYLVPTYLSTYLPTIPYPTYLTPNSYRLREVHSHTRFYCVHVWTVAYTLLSIHIFYYILICSKFFNIHHGLSTLYITQKEESQNLRRVCLLPTCFSIVCRLYLNLLVAVPLSLSLSVTVSLSLSLLACYTAMCAFHASIVRELFD